MAVWFEVRSPSALALQTDPAIAPLRVGAWWLRQELAVARGATAEAEQTLRRPPWIEQYPWWRVGDEGPERLAALRGLDLWVLPDAWKMPRYDHWRGPEAASPIPSDPLLAVLLALGGVGAFLRLRRSSGSH